MTTSLISCSYKGTLTMALSPPEVGKRFLALAQTYYDSFPTNVKTPSQRLTKKLAYSSGFIPGLIKLVKEAFDLTISEVKVESGDPTFRGLVNAAAGFIPVSERNLSFERLIDFLAAYKAPYSAFYNLTDWATITDLRKELESIGLSKQLRVPIVKYAVYFQSSFFNRKSDGTFNYTPEEFTGIMLHELGHLNYFVTCGRTLVFTKEMFHYSLDLPNDKVSTDKLHEMVGTCLENPHLSVFMKKYGTILKHTDITPEDKAWSTYVAACSWFISATLSTISTSIFNQYKTVNETDLGNPSLKNERAADNYAVAAGYGPAVATGLVKGIQIRDLMAIEENVCSMFPPSISAVLDFLLFWSATAIESESSGYDPISVRFAKLIAGAKRALENDQLSPEERESIIASIKRAQRAVDLYNSQAYVLVRKSLHAVMMLIGKTMLFIPRLFLTQVKSSADLLNTSSDTFRNNGLVYWAETLPKGE